MNSFISGSRAMLDRLIKILWELQGTNKVEKEHMKNCFRNIALLLEGKYRNPIRSLFPGRI